MPVTKVSTEVVRMGNPDNPLHLASVDLSPIELVTDDVGRSPGSSTSSDESSATARDSSRRPPRVVVGVDGSRQALDAALWAVDEAVERDVPLRLIYAIGPRPPSPSAAESAARDLATAEIAIRYAVAAVESTEKPVKIEVEIVQEHPVSALLAAARQAAILCVGAHGLHFNNHSRRIGPVAADVATSAVCPVAVIRSYDPNPAQELCVVAEVDEGLADCGVVVSRAVVEARLRKIPLTVVTAWRSRFTDIHYADAVKRGNRLAKAQLDHRLAPWRRENPDVRIRAKAVHGSTSNYLATNAGSIHLLVVDKQLARGYQDLMGRPGYAAPHEADCSVLICEPPNVS